MTESCIYEGTIRHRRLDSGREFSHRLALAYVDLDELPDLLHGRLVRRRPGLLRFRREDYHGDPRLPLATAVGRTVAAALGRSPRGPVRLLTHLRSYGHCFNPVSFYYCLDEAGGVEAMLLEVTNTPWRERHAYVLDVASADSRVVSGSFTKALHVSPFMGMDHRYRLAATIPARTLSVHIESDRSGGAVFDATLSLSRRELTPSTARTLTLRDPFATVRVLTLIYGHALGLKLKGHDVHPHPRREPT